MVDQPVPEQQLEAVLQDLARMAQSVEDILGASATLRDLIARAEKDLQGGFEPTALAALRADMDDIANRTDELAMRLTGVAQAGEFWGFAPGAVIPDDPDEVFVNAVHAALAGEGTFAYASGSISVGGRWIAAVNGLARLDEAGWDTDIAAYRGSFFALLRFRRNRGAHPGLSRRVRDSLVGKDSAIARKIHAEATHEEVRAYREFIDATNALAEGVLITDSYFYAKTIEGNVYGFELDDTRRNVLRDQASLLRQPDIIVKLFLELPLPGDFATRELPEG